MEERYEFREGKSAKFWAVSVDGVTVTANWGRIGTDGCETWKRCGRIDQARPSAQDERPPEP